MLGGVNRIIFSKASLDKHYTVLLGIVIRNMRERILSAETCPTYYY